MHRNPTHRDVLTLVASSFGQRDIERRCRHDRIVKKHFIEITHTEKQQGVRIGFLILEELYHHRRHGTGCIFFGGFGHHFEK